MCNFLNRCAIVTGGLLDGNEQSSNSTFRFDLWMNQWTELPLFNSERHGHTSCALGDSVYIFGGKQDPNIPESDYDSTFERLRLGIASNERV